VSMYGKYRPCGKVDQARSHAQEVTHGISDKWKTTVYAQFAASGLCTLLIKQALRALPRMNWEKVAFAVNQYVQQLRLTEEAREQSDPASYLSLPALQLPEENDFELLEAVWTMGLFCAFLVLVSSSFLFFFNWSISISVHSPPSFCPDPQFRPQAEPQINNPVSLSSSKFRFSDTRMHVITTFHTLLIQSSVLLFIAGSGIQSWHLGAKTVAIGLWVACGLWTLIVAIQTFTWGFDSPDIHLDSYSRIKVGGPGVPVDTASETPERDHIKFLKS